MLCAQCFQHSIFHIPHPTPCLHTRHLQGQSELGMVKGLRFPAYSLLSSTTSPHPQCSFTAFSVPFFFSKEARRCQVPSVVDLRRFELVTRGLQAKVQARFESSQNVGPLPTEGRCRAKGTKRERKEIKPATWFGPTNQRPTFFSRDGFPGTIVVIVIGLLFCHNFAALAPPHPPLSSLPPEFLVRLRRGVRREVWVAFWVELWRFVGWLRRCWVFSDVLYVCGLVGWRAGFVGLLFGRLLSYLVWEGMWVGWESIMCNPFTHLGG